MHDPAALLFFAPMLPRAFVRPLPGVLLFGTLLAFSGIASASSAEPAAESAEASPSDGAESEGNWGPIIGACFGVLFGGVLAVWQIRGMKNRR